ncbi:LuxR family transcriptional regulator [Paenibacillus hodogayensis]|uniref:LuxR family transcriptional regulator n=1 Tax=Paenibacillus hodogayensis TaxID=279208 RepID=A0ABV5W005_9BACL
MDAMDGKATFPTLGDRLESLRGGDFTGRSFELRFFEELLDRLAERMERILNVHGTVGMGKTALLQRFASLAAERGAACVYVDVRQAAGSPGRLNSLILRQMQTGSLPNARSGSGALSLTQPAELEQEGTEAALSCAGSLNGMAAAGDVVLALDHYEEAGHLDGWLRDTLLPSLHTHILIVIAGRFPLQGPWSRSPAWRKLIIALPLTEWSYEEARAYLAARGITDETSADRLWSRTFGHPLSLSLAADGFAASGRAALPKEQERPGERFEELVREWLQEAPDDELRELVMTASIPRTFRLENLAALSRRDIPLALFERLIGLSFVERAAHGWRLHELAREAVRRAFRERFPDRFERDGRKAVSLLRERIAEALRVGRAPGEEAAELLGQIGNPILRAHFRHSRASRNYWEAAGTSHLAEVEAYIRRRALDERDSVVRCSDPETGELFRFLLPARHSALPLLAVNVRELVRLGGGRSLLLLRSPAGEIAGLAAMLPIHAGTLPYLAEAPVSRAYFRSLPAERLAALAVPPEASPGLFLYAADAADPEKEELRSDLVRLKLDHILSGKLLVSSVPPSPYYAQAFASLGFEPVPGAEHDDYGDTALQSPCYGLDTRDGGMTGFLDRAVGQTADRFAFEDMLPSAMAGTQPAAVASGGADRLPARNAGPDSGTASRELGPLSAASATLTPREREVAEWLVQGKTNAEIAAGLYMSVAAVKKHVNAMLRKFGLKNRTQLARAMPAVGAAAPGPFAETQGVRTDTAGN